MSEASIEQFLDECGWSGPLGLGLETLDGASTELHRELRQPFVVVGRRESADVTFDHPDVSRSHAYLQVVAGHVFCIDLQSRTGIYWDGGRQPWGWIEPGAAIRIGLNRIRPWSRVPSIRRCEMGTESLPISGSSGPPGDNDAVLELLDPGDRPSAWWVNSTILLLGRSPVCKVHLPSSLCAAVHASLVRTRAGIWVVDMCSTNGTLVNGVRVRCAKLADGDGLTLGPYRFRIHQGSDATRIQLRFSLPDEPMLTCPDSGRPTPARHVQHLIDATLESIPGQDSLEVELLREIGRQQLETKEQFRQVLGIFYRMHQEQMALVTGELHRLGRLAEAHSALRDARDSRSPSPDPSAPDDRRGRSPSRLPLPPSASGAESRLKPPKRAETESRHRPASGSRPGAIHNSPDPSGGIHLVIARRIAACRRNDQGRIRKIIGWLSRSTSANAAI